MYNMIKEFMGTQPIFTPPYVKDFMVDGDDVYESHNHTLVHLQYIWTMIQEIQKKSLVWFNQ